MIWSAIAPTDDSAAMPDACSNISMSYLPTPDLISDKFVEQASTRVDMKGQGVNAGSASVSVPTRLESLHSVS
jgi:hypothetical protein